MTGRDPLQEELIFRALAERMALVTWTRLDDSGTPVGNPIVFKTKSRRVKLFADSGPQPACYQAEHADNINQVSGMPYKEVWEANWVVYQDVAKDASMIPTAENNLIIGGIRKALEPLPTDVGFLDERCTLGNLVYHCYIQGRLFKDPGDIDNQGMLVIPIKLLVP